MAIDVSRLTEGVMLSPEVSAQIQADVLENSAVQSLASKIDMPAAGISWQTITGEPEAQWVGETDEKPVSRPSFGSDTVAPYKMAVIVPFSDEFRRDAGRLFSEVQRRIPYALGRLFDRTALGLEAAPGEHFDQLSDATAVEYDGSSADSAYDSLLDVDAAVSQVGVLNGWALAPSARNKLMRVRVNGSPLFANDVQSGGVYSTLIGGRVEYRRALGEVPGLMGYGGDWSRAQWGTVEGVKLSASSEATLTETGPFGEAGAMVTRTLNLWQRNMFALRAEIEVAFKADTAAFARLTDAV